MSLVEVLANVEIETHPGCIQYPSLWDFLKTLDNDAPGYDWLKRFFQPLTRMGVRTLDDMCIVSPESLHVFCGLPPIAVMDFYAHVVDAIEILHCSRNQGYFVCDVCQSPSSRWVVMITWVDDWQHWKTFQSAIGLARTEVETHNRIVMYRGCRV